MNASDRRFEAALARKAFLRLSALPGADRAGRSVFDQSVLIRKYSRVIADFDRSARLASANAHFSSIDLVE